MVNFLSFRRRFHSRGSVGRLHAFIWIMFAVPMLSGSTRGLSDDALPTEEGARFLDLAIEAVEKVRCFSMRDVVVAPDDTPAASDPAVERDASGYPLFSYTTLWWDKRGMMRVDTRQWQSPHVRRLFGETAYDHYVYSVINGRYTGKSYSSQRAKIEDVAHKPSFVTPLTFLGYDIYGIDSHICRYVKDSGSLRSARFSRIDDGVQLVCEYETPQYGLKTLRLVLGREHQWLPILIETREGRFGLLEQRIVVSETLSMSGVLVPVSGDVSGFHVEERFPNGLTIEDINNMTREEYFTDVEPHTVRSAVLSAELLDVDLRKQDLSVNAIEPPDFFEVLVPPHYDLDDFTVTDAD